MGPNQKDYLQENVSISEQKNRFLDEYNGKPTVEKINQIIARKREQGDTDKKIWVDMMWLLELIEHYVANTSFTYQMVHDAPTRLYKMEQQMLAAQNKANLEHKKAQDLLIENTLIAERLDSMAQEYKEKEAGFSSKIAESRIIKLPISRVSSFLAFCKKEELESSTEEFYVKIDDNGNMQRIVRKPEEL